MAAMTARDSIPWWAQYGFAAPEPAVAFLTEFLSAIGGDERELDALRTDGYPRGRLAELLDLMRAAAAAGMGTHQRAAPSARPAPYPSLGASLPRSRPAHAIPPARPRSGGAPNVAHRKQFKPERKRR